MELKTVVKKFNYIANDFEIIDENTHKLDPEDVVKVEIYLTDRIQGKEFTSSEPVRSIVAYLSEQHGQKRVVSRLKKQLTKEIEILLQNITAQPVVYHKNCVTYACEDSEYKTELISRKSLEELTIPKTCCSFYMYDQFVEVAEIDGKKYILQEKKKNNIQLYSIGEIVKKDDETESYYIKTKDGQNMLLAGEKLILPSMIDEFGKISTYIEDIEI